MENIFDKQIIEAKKISATEFQERTKRLLNKIFAEYGSSFERPVMTDEEQDAAPCEKCQGSMCWKFNTEEIQCFQDRAEGECHKVLVNEEVFGAVMAHIIETNEDFNELLTSEVAV